MQLDNMAMSARLFSGAGDTPDLNSKVCSSFLTSFRIQNSHSLSKCGKRQIVEGAMTKVSPPSTSGLRGSRRDFPRDGWRKTWTWFDHLSFWKVQFFVSCQNMTVEPIRPDGKDSRLLGR